MARVQTRRKRRPTTFRLHRPHWVDPYPWIPGTEPEKRLFEALIKRHVYFLFQASLPELEKGLYVTMNDPKYKPDILIPEYRLILDPFSPYHHSLPEGEERDARKRAIYRAFGYRFCHPWAYAEGLFILDQPEYARGRYQGGEALLGALPELASAPIAKLTDPRDLRARSVGYRLGENLGAGATSVAAANKARARPKGMAIRRTTRR